MTQTGPASHTMNLIVKRMYYYKSALWVHCGLMIAIPAVMDIP